MERTLERNSERFVIRKWDGVKLQECRLLDSKTKVLALSFVAKNNVDTVALCESRSVKYDLLRVKLLYLHQSDILLKSSSNNNGINV